MTTALEHIENAIHELEEAQAKLGDEMGTRMMVDEVTDDLQALASRYRRIHNDE